MVEIIRDRIFSAIVCCDIDPSNNDCYDELDRQLEGIFNGTINGWKALRQTDSLWNLQCAPLPCEETPGRWHYVVIT